MTIPEDQLKQLILSSHIVNEEVLANVQTYAKDSGVSLTEALIEKDIITDERLGQALAQYLNVPYVAVSKLSIPPDVIHIIPPRIAKKQKVIPFERDQSGIKVAMVDPGNRELLQMLTKKTGQQVIPYLSTERDIYDTLHVFRKDLQTAFDDLLRGAISPTGVLQVERVPIVKIVDLLIEESSVAKASDIHIEPEEKNSLVRFRIDGILHDVLFISRDLHAQIVSRIKVLSNLRTDEHLAPQDGKIRMQLDEEVLDLRVSILPVVEGEKIVLRLLSSHFRQFSLGDMGMNAHDLKKVDKAVSKSYGMILSTGPTGSGKTTSIYSILKVLNVREKNITTIEDPVEYRIKGLNQIQVNVKTNLTFASGLRSILRQDPNVVFVGEIRDGETAGIAVNAALTGHLVLSTLHTNDAPTALPRLTDMKIEPFLVASTVSIIIAQRLVRKICENCRTSFVVTEQELTKTLPADIIKKHYVGVGEERQVRVYKGKGCKSCHLTGYSGRIGIYEVLEMTEKVRSLIAAKNDSNVIRKAAIEGGMTTMLDDGLEKVSRGVTTIEEVLRVTKVESL